MRMITKDTNRKPEYNKYYNISEDIKTNNNTYRIGELLGVGGNAAVYDCVDKKGNIYAIKFLLNFGYKVTSRFKQEIAILKDLRHPHIIRFIDSGVVAGTHSKNEAAQPISFIVMEKADKNIVEYMKINNKIGYETFAPQFRGLSEALSCLHKIAIHRDIKPENILVKGETWLISDLGLCLYNDKCNRLNLTEEDQRIGPKCWLSPEAADRGYFGHNKIDCSSDVYQLCAVFWFIVTSRCPMGVIYEDDYEGYETDICKTLLQSLRYCKQKRAKNGKDLYDSIYNATVNRGLA